MDGRERDNFNEQKREGVVSGNGAGEAERNNDSRGDAAVGDKLPAMLAAVLEGSKDISKEFTHRTFLKSFEKNTIVGLWVVS